jgi:hypothetical protein
MPIPTTKPRMFRGLPSVRTDAFILQLLGADSSWCDYVSNERHTKARGRSLSSTDIVLNARQAQRTICSYISSQLKIL